MSGTQMDGRVAIVTGSGRGLGRSHALLLGSLGAKVVVNDLASADEVVELIRAAGGDAVADSSDISTPEGAATLVKAAVDTYGSLDTVVNNAGVGRFTTMDDVTIEEYELVRSSGLDGTFYVTHAAWTHLKASGRGRVVITTSGNGLIGAPSSISYSIAKAGVFGLMRAAAIDGAESGILVNSIGPMAATPMSVKVVTEEVAAQMQVDYPTELVSPIVAVLAGDACTVTGHHFDVGGGWLASSFVGTTQGIYDRSMTPDSIVADWSKILDEENYVEFRQASDTMAMVQTAKTGASV
ncbi:SDR family NAD(P)-dependent oxidoreductase [Frondihabitans cladoniiphilus]|uniref:SDR family oxidoreductase n=1 Tax=Frondihabitans cladoniiphilus TaxID=715785 RepID=A0ABP8WA09_9MICO